MTTQKQLGIHDSTAGQVAHSVYVAYRDWERARDEAIARHNAR